MPGKWMSEGSPEAIEAEQKKRVAQKLEERRRWWELRAVYERCVAIADQVWNERLAVAQIAQEAIAQGMRDRGSEGNAGGLGIPVPLFTPRDREQFIKEVATTLLIEANRRGLNATPEPKPQEAPAIEAASGTDEGLLDQEATELADAGSSPAAG